MMMAKTCQDELEDSEYFRRQMNVIIEKFLASTTSDLRIAQKNSELSLPNTRDGSDWHFYYSGWAPAGVIAVLAAVAVAVVAMVVMQGVRRYRNQKLRRRLHTHHSATQEHSTHPRPLSSDSQAPPWSPGRSSSIPSSKFGTTTTHSRSAPSSSSGPHASVEDHAANRKQLSKRHLAVIHGRSYPQESLSMTTSRHTTDATSAIIDRDSHSSVSSSTRHDTATTTASDNNNTGISMGGIQVRTGTKITVPMGVRTFLEFSAWDAKRKAQAQAAKC
jgi:hypothetical protein